MSKPSRLTGRCNCGAVTFRAEGPFRPPRACHCTSCRRQSGHFLAATQTDRDKITITGSGELAWFRASDDARRGFCRTCGAHLFWERNGSDRTSIFMGCIDAPTGLVLADHIYVAEKGDYYQITDHLPVFAGPVRNGT